MAPSGKKHIDWEALRSEIEEMYWAQDKPLTDVMRRIERHHGIQATKKMYKKQIRAWDLGKNINKDEMIKMLRIQERRRKENKETEFFLRGRPVDPAKLRRFATRYRLTSFDDGGSPPDQQEIPPRITYSTPEPEAPSPSLPYPSKNTDLLVRPLISEADTANIGKSQQSPRTKQYQALSFADDDSYRGISSPAGWNADGTYQSLDPPVSAHPSPVDLPLFSPQLEPNIHEIPTIRVGMSAEFFPNSWTQFGEDEAFMSGPYSRTRPHMPTGRLYFAEHVTVGVTGNSHHQQRGATLGRHVFPAPYSSQYSLAQTAPSATQISSAGTQQVNSNQSRPTPESGTFLSAGFSGHHPHGEPLQYNSVPTSSYPQQRQSASLWSYVPAPLDFLDELTFTCFHPHPQSSL